MSPLSPLGSFSSLSAPSPLSPLIPLSLLSPLGPWVLLVLWVSKTGNCKLQTKHKESDLRIWQSDLRLQDFEDWLWQSEDPRIRLIDLKNPMIRYENVTLVSENLTQAQRPPGPSVTVMPYVAHHTKTLLYQNTALLCTEFHCTKLHSTDLYCTDVRMLYCIVLHRMYSTDQFNLTQWLQLQ